MIGHAEILRSVRLGDGVGGELLLFRPDRKVDRAGDAEYIQIRSGERSIGWTSLAALGELRLALGELLEAETPAPTWVEPRRMCDPWDEPQPGAVEEGQAGDPPV